MKNIYLTILATIVVVIFANAVEAKKEIFYVKSMIVTPSSVDLEDYEVRCNGDDIALGGGYEFVNVWELQGGNITIPMSTFLFDNEVPRGWKVQTTGGNASDIRVSVSCTDK